MADLLALESGAQILLCETEGPALSSEQDALNLIGESFGHEIAVVAIPAQRLDSRFFSLSSGIAGAFTQKFVTYQIKLAIIGDISSHLEQSSALRAYVHETNRGNQVWFLDDLTALNTQLSPGL